MPESTAPSFFVSYSHHDADWRAQLFDRCIDTTSGDCLVWSDAQLRAGDLEERKIAQKDRDLNLKRDQLVLAQERLQIETCEKFLAWYKDSRAREIAESVASNTEKIAALRQAFFSDVDEMERSGQVQLPQ